MAHDKGEPHLITQAVAGVVAADHDQLAAQVSARLAAQGEALGRALGEIDKVRQFVGTPERILGNPATKHGEIAEQVDVGVRNAWDYLRHKLPSATFDGVPRTGVADYRIDGVEVQSKFINGARNTLDHVLEHMRTNKSFGRDGSYYHIPRDQHELISKVLNREDVEGLTARSQSALLTKVQEAEGLAGRPIGSVVKPSVSSYQEVTRGRIGETLDQHDQSLRAENGSVEAKISAEAQPSVEGTLGAAGKGALVGAGLKLTLALYARVKDGKNPFRGEFTAADWKDIGIQTAEGGVQGGVAAGALYALTSYTDLAAPFAGAVVSSLLAVKELSKSYRSGEISFDEFVDLGQVTCAEGAIVALASAVGQALIPIPALGALVGALGGRILTGAAKQLLTADSTRLEKQLAGRFERQLSALDAAMQTEIENIIRRYDRLGELTLAAFDVERNTELRLAASIDLARAYGVDERDIIHTVDELDDFMLR